VTPASATTEPPIVAASATRRLRPTSSLGPLDGQSL
jgi:hypothetical protein